ncbi:hypothetical protein T310_4600, partial [Rasamsonia emersonii CBS 393.64]
RQLAYVIEDIDLTLAASLFTASLFLFLFFFLSLFFPLFFFSFLSFPFFLFFKLMLNKPPKLQLHPLSDLRSRPPDQSCSADWLVSPLRYGVHVPTAFNIVQSVGP